MYSPQEQVCKLVHSDELIIHLVPEQTHQFHVKKDNLPRELIEYLVLKQTHTFQVVTYT